MQDIAAELRIKAASLYNHIDSKQEMLRELLDRGANMFMKSMEGIKDSSLSSLEKIEKLISAHVQLATQHSDLMAIMVVEWRHLEGDAKTQYLGQREQYEEDFRNILKTAIAEGTLKPINIEIALFTILNTLQRLYAWHERHADVNVFDVEKQLMQCLLGGIKT